MRDDRIGRRRPVRRTPWFWVVAAGLIVVAAFAAAAFVENSSRQANGVFAAGEGLAADGGGPVQAQDADGLIRLHVIANSDAPADQALKLDVRDAILARFAGEFAGLSSVAQAEDAIRASLAAIADTAAVAVKRFGKDYPVTAEFSVFPFPVKTYGSFVLPAGSYKALRVVIGEGQGKNWWCILFPPVCFLNVDSAVADSRVRVLGAASASAGGAGRSKVVLSFRLGETIFAGAGPRSSEPKHAAAGGGRAAGAAGAAGSKLRFPANWWPVALWSVLRLIQLGG